MYKYLHVFRVLAEDGRGLRRDSVRLTGGRAQLAPTHLQWLLRLLTKTVGAVFDRQPCLLRYSVGWTGGRAQVVLHTTYNGY
jgi:hypothetical protein